MLLRSALAAQIKPVRTINFLENPNLDVTWKPDSAVFGSCADTFEHVVLEWTPESDARVRLSESDLIEWYSTAKAGSFLVCSGSGARFATIRPRPNGDLLIAELEQHATSALVLAGDPEGGLYYAGKGPLRTGIVDSTGHLTSGMNVYGSSTNNIRIGRGSKHLFAAQSEGLNLYRAVATLAFN